MRARRGRRAFLDHSALADGRKKGDARKIYCGMKMGEVAREGYEVPRKREGSTRVKGVPRYCRAARAILGPTDNINT